MVAAVDGVAVDIVDGVAADVDAVDDLVDSEQVTSPNVIVTTSSVVPQRITRDRCAGSCVNRERVQSAARILLLRLRDCLRNGYRYLEPPRGFVLPRPRRTYSTRVNLHDLRGDRPDLYCEPQQAEGCLAIFNWTRQLLRGAGRNWRAGGDVRGIGWCSGDLAGNWVWVKLAVMVAGADMSVVGFSHGQHPVEEPGPQAGA